MVVLGGGAYLYAASGRYESTDDAYTQEATVSISANVAGRISEIEVRDNERVERGATLFRLDDAPVPHRRQRRCRWRIAPTRGYKSTSLKSTYRGSVQVELRAARDTQRHAQQQYDRQNRLLDHLASRRRRCLIRAAHALDAARQQVANVQQQIGVALANLEVIPNIAPARHPRVAQAQAELRSGAAQLILSSIGGHRPDGWLRPWQKVEQLRQIGDTIAASAPVFALVSIRDIFLIEANFKEVQLARMRPGQAATVEIDRYPSRARFSAEVTSVSPSTGSQFSLLPPENGTGNWVKVVQRGVLVRLRLVNIDSAFVLQAGLSSDVTIDTRHPHDHISPSVPGAARSQSLLLRPHPPPRPRCRVEHARFRRLPSSMQRAGRRSRSRSCWHRSCRRSTPRSLTSALPRIQGSGLRNSGSDGVGTGSQASSPRRLP